MDNNLNDYTWIAFFNIMTKIISVISIIGCFIAGIIVSANLPKHGRFLRFLSAGLFRLQYIMELICCCCRFATIYIAYERMAKNS
ncbi:hypothetical protein EOM82_03120 [bacterium]|nr:hypothetical protein [bacterium]